MLPFSLGKIGFNSLGRERGGKGPTYKIYTDEHLRGISDHFGLLFGLALLRWSGLAGVVDAARATNCVDACRSFASSRGSLNRRGTTHGRRWGHEIVKLFHNFIVRVDRLFLLGRRHDARLEGMEVDCGS